MSLVPVRIEVLDCSPAGGGRTAAALHAVAGAAREAGAEVTVWQVPDAAAPSDELLAAAAAAGGFVFGSPVYRASFATPLKALLDNFPRGGEHHVDSALRGKAAAMVLTAGSYHHYLALDDLRSVLAGFFAAHVLPPGLYVPREGFDDVPSLRPPFAEAAALLGRAVVELAHVLSLSTSLKTLEPQV